MRDLENTTLTSKEEAARQYDFIEKAKALVAEKEKELSRKLTFCDNCSERGVPAFIPVFRGSALKKVDNRILSAKDGVRCNFCYRCGNYNGMSSAHTSEGVLSDIRYTVGNNELGDIFCAKEGKVTDCFKRIAEFDFLESIASSECIFTNGSNAVSNS